MNVVQGKNVSLEVLDVASASFLFFVCASSVSINYKPEKINKTTLTTGRGYEYKIRRIDWTISLSGISTIVDAGQTVFETLDIERMFGEYHLRMTFTDDLGNTATFEGIAVLDDATINGPQEGFADYDMTFQGSGLPSQTVIDDTPEPAPEASEYLSDWWTVTAGLKKISGASAVHGYSLVDTQVLEVSRSGDQYDLVTSVPGNRQARHNGTTGEIDFDIEFNDGETVFVLFKTL